MCDRASTLSHRIAFHNTNEIISEFRWLALVHVLYHFRLLFAQYFIVGLVNWYGTHGINTPHTETFISTLRSAGQTFPTH